MRLPYPYFMETDHCTIYNAEGEIWQGKCFFAWKIKSEQDKEGTNRHTTAKITIGQCIPQLLEPANNHGNLKLSLEKHGKTLNFIITEITPAYNPDSSMHHIVLGLAE